MLEEAKLSPEQFGERVGLSGMTLRRWKKLPQNQEIPKFYTKNLIGGLYDLIQEGLLSSRSKTVELLLKDQSLSSFEGTIKNLGLENILKEKGSVKKKLNPENAIIAGLAKMGAETSKIDLVTHSEKKILSFQKIGKEWPSRIRTLLRVIKSKKLTVFEKFAAYGALFYLINPLDLIPDHLPVFGFIDDFAIIGFAVAYYLKRFKEI